MKRIFFPILSILLVNVLFAQKPLYKDANAPIEVRVKDLLSRMTIADKCKQLDIWHVDSLKTSDKKVFEQVLRSLGDTINDGIGFLQFETKLTTDKYIPNFNAIQKYLVEKTRLGIPAISNGEGCHGFVGNDTKSTVFPTPTLLGSTWNPELIESVYGAVAKEMRSYGIQHAATPVIDLLRDPRFGRSEEFFGEDPYHVAMMGVGAILGLQGRTPMIDENHLLACAKHFAGHGQPESGINLSPVNFSERVLRENHFYPFEMAIKKANVRTVMASYNEIDGVPNHANDWLLNGVLRGEWGFTGYVISDYDAVNRMITRQHACVDKADAAKKSLNAGMDFECPSNWQNYCFRSLPALIKAGEVKESVLDSAVARILRNKFIMGLFENPYIKVISEKEIQEMYKKDREIALKAAEEGMILLRNENKTLPFTASKIKRLAIIGPNADEVHYGNYSNDKTPGISILEGMKIFGKDKFEVVYSEGYKIYVNDTTIKAADKTIEAENLRIQKAVELAKTCDAVLLVMGGNELVCREDWANHSGDYYDLNLMGRQDDLAKAIFGLNKQTAVVLINGRPQSTNYLSANAPALIEGWYLGQEQGTAVANVIFGNVVPSGKLPVTIPRHVGQLPVFYNHKPYIHESPYIDGPFSPLYPFGFGLSYTTFSYKNLKLETTQIKPTQSLKVSVEISNTGDYDASEIVQLYIRDMVSSITRPAQELKDFAKIKLAKGETKTVEFTITPDKLQFFNIDMKRVVEAGEFEVQIGRSSADYLSAKFQVK